MQFISYFSDKQKNHTKPLFSQKTILHGFILVVGENTQQRQKFISFLNRQFRFFLCFRCFFAFVESKSTYSIHHQIHDRDDNKR